jgi:hypothetical protein
VGEDSALIDAYYPGNLPLPDHPQRLFRAGLWDKHVSILLSDLSIYPTFEISKLADVNIKHLHAHISEGERYGLVHNTQAAKGKRDYKDIWLEKVDGVTLSYITCTKRILPNDAPQCTHEFNDEHFFYQVAYDEGLLPQWKAIRQNVLSLVESFASESEAHILQLKLQTANLNFNEKGK